MIQKFLLLALIVVALISFGCNDSDDEHDTYSSSPGDDDDDDNDDDDDDDNDTGPHRSFYMAAAPFEFVVTDTSVHSDFSTEGFAGKLDMISLHMDGFFGMPWQEFANGTALPQAWLDEMDENLEMTQKLGVKVYLSITPLSGFRNMLQDTATDVDGNLVIESDLTTECFDFDNDPRAASVKEAYLAYVRWMVDKFQPTFFTHGIETNMFFHSCPEQYPSLISLLNEAYDQEKALNPDLIIFPTFVIEPMWDIGDDGQCEPGDRSCFEEALSNHTELQRDRFGISNYPAWLAQNYGALPEDYYTGVKEMTGEQIVFGEIGYPSRSVNFPYPTLEDDCMQILVSSESDQNMFLESLFEQADSMDSDLLVWWSIRDFFPDHIYENCPCASPGLWCVLYEALYEIDLLHASLAWGSMGVIDYDLQPKSSLTTWESWLTRTRNQ